MNRILYLFIGFYRFVGTVKQDYSKVAKFYQKACDGGYDWGCFDLGSMYANGEGVQQDNKKKEELFKKYCELQSEPNCEVH